MRMKDELIIVPGIFNSVSDIDLEDRHTIKIDDNIDPLRDGIKKIGRIFYTRQKDYF